MSNFKFINLSQGTYNEYVFINLSQGTYNEYLLRYFVVFIRGVGKVIRCLTALMVSSQSASLTNCSYSQRPEGCPVSKQKSRTNYV